MSEAEDLFIWDCERCATRKATYEAHLIAIPPPESINAPVKFYNKHYCSGCVLDYQNSPSHEIEVLRALDSRVGSPKHLSPSDLNPRAIQLPTTLDQFF